MVMSSSAATQRILFLAANPKNTSRLRLDEEVREISAGLERAKNREQFELLQKWATRPRDVQRAMLDIEPQIVHFSGHGAGERGLIFENDIGVIKFISGEALSGLFELFANQVDCVLLNGCYSQVQAEAIAQHIPYVIGMQQEVGDESAIAFSVGFYDALGAGRSIQDAYKFGCSAIQLEGLKGDFIPKLCQSKDTNVLDLSSTDQSLIDAAKSMKDPCELLIWMESQSRKFINTPRLKAFLTWANEKREAVISNRTTVDRIAAILIISDRYQLQGRKHLYDIADYFSIPLIDWIKSVHEDGIVLKKYPIGIDTTFPFYAYLGIPLAKSIIKFGLLNDLDFERLIFDMRTVERQTVEELERCFPDEYATSEVFNKFTPRYIKQFWFEALHFDADLLSLSGSEDASLNHYLHLNWLILQCLKEAKNKIPETAGKKLEQRMLTIDP